MKILSEWSEKDRAGIANPLRKISQDAPPIPASWLAELATAIDNLLKPYEADCSVIFSTNVASSSLASARRAEVKPPREKDPQGGLRTWGLRRPGLASDPVIKFREPFFVPLMGSKRAARFVMNDAAQ